MNNKIIMLATIAMSIMTSMFKSKRKGTDPFQPTAPLPTGEIHITSYGKKRVYPLSTKRDSAKHEKHLAMVEELREQGVHWYNNKLYWETRQLAIENS